jgi:hypothetical protein
VSGEFRSAFVVFWGLVGLAVILATFPPDDGLRHVGLAFAPDARAWGDVYPFSVFEAHRSYNPWLGYDLTLRGLAWLAGKLPLSRLTLQLLLIKLVGLAVAGGLLWLAVRRSRLLGEIKDGASFLLATLVVLVLLGEALLRFVIARPFALGTLYLLYVGGARVGPVGGGAASALLFFFYPYLAWIYTGPAALAHLVRGRRWSGVAIAGVTGVALLLQPRAFWNLLLEMVAADRLRAELLPKISEFVSPLSSLTLAGVLVLGWLVLRPGFAASRRGPAPLLALLFLVPALKHVRYLIDVVLPLLLVAYGADLVRSLHGPARRVTGYWRERLARWLRRPPPAAAEAAPASRGRLTPVLALLCVLALGSLGWIGVVRHGELVRLDRELAGLPRKSLVLTEFNLQYRLLYVRPDLSLVPCSEIGFARAEIRAAYIGFLNRGEVCPLARQIGADFFVEQQGMYVDPASLQCLELQGEVDRVRVWRVRR